MFLYLLELFLKTLLDDENVLKVLKSFFCKIIIIKQTDISIAENIKKNNVKESKLKSS